MACLQIYRELLSLTTFLRVHSNSKEVSYLSWQNTYPNLKTTGQTKLKFFLWTKLLENLLLTKYLISVAVPLIKYMTKRRRSCINKLKINDVFIDLCGTPAIISLFKLNLLLIWTFCHLFFKYLCRMFRALVENP